MRRLVGYKELKGILPVARITVMRWTKRKPDPFPIAVRIGGRTFWWLDEVLAWAERQPRFLPPLDELR